MPRKRSRNGSYKLAGLAALTAGRVAAYMIKKEEKKHAKEVAAYMIKKKKKNMPKKKQKLKLKEKVLEIGLGRPPWHGFRLCGNN